MKKNDIQKLVKPSINKIAKYIPGESSINGKTNIIKLSSNESPFSIPKKVSKSVNSANIQVNLYPDGDSVFLKKKISKTFNLNKDQIICGNGSDDILSIIAQAFLRENDEVICSEYGFIYYPIIAKASGARVITAKSKNLNISCENILKSISKKTKIIFFANPNNPTGSIIFRKELNQFLRQIPKNIIVVVDGAYSEFILNKKYSDGLDLVKKFSNLIVTRTFSKIFALAGLRLGWAYASREIIYLLEKIRGPFNVNLYAQKIGASILQEKGFLKKSINHNIKWQKKLPKLIKKLGLYAQPTYANFILVKVDKKKFDKKKIIKGLLSERIIVRDLSSYGLDDFFRVSVGSDTQLNIFVNSLKKILNKASNAKKN